MHSRYRKIVIPLYHKIKINNNINNLNDFQMKTVFLTMLAFMLLLLSCSTKNTPLPVLEGNLRPDWIPIEKNNYNSQWYIYSAVDLDSNAYIVQYRIDLSDENKEYHSYSFDPAYEYLTYLLDTLLNKDLLVHNEITDSTRKENHNYSTKYNTWEHLQPNTITYDNAPIAEMLYKDAHNLVPKESYIQVNWGKGKWVKLKDKEDNIYYLDHYIKKDSCVIVWAYIQNVKMSERLLYAYYVSDYNERRLSYGQLSKIQYNQVDKKMRTLESYYIDKYGHPFYQWNIQDSAWHDAVGSFLEKFRC